MNHEYGHIASDSNGVNNRYEPVEENWANYFSCKSRETTVYDFWGTAIDVTNLEDTDGDRQAGGQTYAEDFWNFQLAGIYWQLAENSVISSLKTSGLNTPQQFYNAYKTTVAADTNRSKEIKRIFRDHGINAQAWAPAGYNIGLRQFEVESTGIQAGQYLTGAYAHGVVDGNGDGTYEGLNIYVTVNISATGAYYLLGFISPASGGDVCFASNYTNVSAGIRNITLSFSGECIFKNQLDGVYMLSNIALENGSLVEIDSASQPYNTSSYNHTQFSSPRIFYTGTHSDTGLNTDGDPAYEFLKVTVEMNVSTSGNFTMQGVLLDGNGNPIFSRNHHFSQAEALLPTAPGVINISLNFTGMQIRASQANGPYTVQLYVYNGSNYELLVYSYSTGFNTSAYNASDFEGSGTEFAGTPTESAVDTDNNTFYNQIQVNATLNISADGTYVLSAHLYDGSGTAITSTANSTNLSAGTQQMTLALDGRDIRSKAVNGPYNITCRLYSGQNLVSSATRSTASYAYASFDAYGDDYFTIAYADHGTDAGGDGKYDYLTLDMNASTKLNGSYATYKFVASLYDASGTFVTQSDVNASLNNQSKSVQVNFTGEHVWAKKKVNGTYNITLEIYRYASNGTLVAELKNVYTTSAYNYTQFESKPAEFGGTYSDAGVDTDGDSLYNLLRVSVGVNVSENGTYSLTGYLYDVNGSYIVSDDNETELASGAKTVFLYFDGYEVYNHGVNGSYTLKNIVLYKNGSQADYKETAYNTTSYAYTSFQRSQVALTGNYSSYGLDTNNNSKYRPLA
ncbi:hypothetical protein COT02_02305 [Candidatus Roizmanbacteria bacterium CG07_land_8_20_14_0_80_34_15]|uniref:Uncharacterized protein n=1 Tax=Candidatus Roizmanbacteria bacterium CG07_land_8_20_14_0_80_34_15 TaxID=1974849 RepID=A0A2M6YUN7_9BACT|nr:MAG: hypothetical protein COT02_02305 [Candidatus Roizmanbacteria bacterium CG07_land_8_20_14_0_80_34_15]